jgi:phage-related minor tail protein
MKEKLTQRLGWIGAGIGLGLFAIFGLLPGAYLGGILGLNTANTLAGLPLEPTLLHRLLTALGMLSGVIVTGLFFVLGGAVLGWLAGVAVLRVVETGKPAGDRA